MNDIGNCLLNVSDSSGSNLLDELLHLSLANLAIVVIINLGEHGVELLLGESVLFSDLNEIGNDESLHLNLGELARVILVIG